MICKTFKVYIRIKIEQSQHIKTWNWEIDVFWKICLFWIWSQQHVSRNYGACLPLCCITPAFNSTLLCLGTEETYYISFESTFFPHSCLMQISVAQWFSLVSYFLLHNAWSVFNWWDINERQDVVGNCLLITSQMVPLFRPENVVCIICKNNFKFWLVRPQDSFPLYLSPSKMSLKLLHELQPFCT